MMLQNEHSKVHRISNLNNESATSILLIERPKYYMEILMLHVTEFCIKSQQLSTYRPYVIQQGINYQWTPREDNLVMQQMSMIAIKVKDSILIIKKK